MKRSTNLSHAPCAALCGFAVWLLVSAGGCASTGSTSAPALMDADPASPALAARSTDLPIGSVLDRTPWEFGTLPGWRISTMHYDIHTTLTQQNVLDQFAPFMEEALQRYMTALGDLPEPGQRLELYLFNDRSQWLAKTGQLMPDQADSFKDLGRGGYATRGIAVLYYIDWRGRYHDTFAIAAHEGWHQYTQSTFRNPLPVWLEEGIATYMEGVRLGAEEPEFIPARNWERRSALRGAIRRDRLIPLDELMRETPQTFLQEGKGRLLIYYAQVWALTRFLSEGADGRYRGALERVLRDAADGQLHRNARGRARSGPAVLLAYFTDDLAAFEAEYVAFARGLAEGGEYENPGRTVAPQN